MSNWIDHTDSDDFGFCIAVSEDAEAPNCDEIETAPALVQVAC